jgi:hypothetical protein
MANPLCVERIHSMLTGYPAVELVAVHALETGGVNEIPAALAKLLAKHSKLKLNDSIVGQGGTLANLIGFIHSGGGVVLGATVLTGKPYSVKLAPDTASIQSLRNKHGQELEEWWRQQFGFGFDHLTRSEARYLEQTSNAQTIRDRLIAAGLESSLEGR